MARSSVRETGAPFRRPINLSIDSALIEEAKALAINVSRACEEGLRDQIRAEKSARWLEENQAAIEASNAYVAEHGLPLERYRVF
ncbi:MAG: Post-segregation antitoxin (ccd killing mechanism protein) encoded by the plasmid [Sphingomonas bacterium]|jgi:antitoxin CcdA|nr:Post-segregation antitoxin (ccd killing mechanism protein) encoded by the plasmid [Sphingomonas bacterium]